MSDFQQSVMLMHSVCEPRTLKQEKPFETQSVFVYAYDEDEDFTLDGYCWNQGMYADGEFHHASSVSDVLYWSPAVYFSLPEDFIRAMFEGSGIGVNKSGLVMTNLMFLSVKYPDPRTMNLPVPQKQSEIYYPRPMNIDVELDAFHPVYGEHEGKLSWWYNDGDVENITHYMPDNRIEPSLLRDLFPNP